ncbi:hypothetical protein [Bacillus sp. G402]|uniref:hypothetical protein n=1 Tax=Bacillus sp. G402 TaxID=3444317 RepID=UPI003EB7D525
MKEYVKNIRFDNEGFYCKPYNSPVYYHSLKFINYEVTNLEATDVYVKKTDFIRPENNYGWNGCFVFLEIYDKKLLLKDGALAMKRFDKKNIAYLKNEGQTIWVRNNAHIGNFAHYYWVKMKIDLALQRIKLGERHLGYVPEWLSECYILEHQVRQFEFIDTEKETSEI